MFFTFTEGMVKENQTNKNGKFSILDQIQPIYAEWNFPPLSIGTVHFCCKGCWVAFFIFIQILIEHSAIKQWRT